ncbi:glycosyl hydrolase family 18 protein [Cohnella lubricantis]|uniref:Glycosyl hydrolase n=1 Tax=Cohnella lubricantis TaxID=2163172 RepID=A0A841TA80_9BACL|nr:glycosyl hydrolase family 18 protein [Cohnella lubricantis]MBB6676308.1 glycosyl hydrolase [Cohnella lubricantis]MBP2119622.1 spore germination protein YaaH [Cohnella lubricantis]
MLAPRSLRKRSSRKQSVLRRVAILASVLCLLAAVGVAWLLIDNHSPDASKKPQRAESPPELSAWLADWEWEAGLSDLRTAAAGMSGLQVFAAYFDKEDHLTFTTEFQDAYGQIREAAETDGVEHLSLTVVNDILYEDGTESQKDADLIGRLTADSGSRGRHVEEIVNALRSYPFDGVELDYEKIPSSDWDGMSLLISELYERLAPLGKSLRVVLEPGIPFDKVKLPSGPTYVVMAYNLHGGFSGPGPKADLSFIRKLGAKMDSLPGEPYLALAAGGFDWLDSSGKVTSLTERQAEELASLSEASPGRDSESGSLHFRYEDDDGNKHTVWYADEETLALWAETARSIGYSHVAIWRLGGIGEESLGWMKSVGASS